MQAPIILQRCFNESTSRVLITVPAIFRSLRFLLSLQEYCISSRFIVFIPSHFTDYIEKCPVEWRAFPTVSWDPLETQTLTSCFGCAMPSCDPASPGWKYRNLPRYTVTNLHFITDYNILHLILTIDRIRTVSLSVCDRSEGAIPSRSVRFSSSTIRRMPAEMESVLFSTDWGRGPFLLGVCAGLPCHTAGMAGAAMASSADGVTERGVR